MSQKKTSAIEILKKDEHSFFDSESDNHNSATNLDDLEDQDYCWKEQN